MEFAKSATAERSPGREDPEQLKTEASNRKDLQSEVLMHERHEQAPTRSQAH